MGPSWAILPQMPGRSRKHTIEHLSGSINAWHHHCASQCAVCGVNVRTYQCSESLAKRHSGCFHKPPACLAAELFQGFLDGWCLYRIHSISILPALMSLYCGLSSNHAVFEHYLTQVTSEVFESLSTLRVSVMCFCQGAASRILPTV